MLQQYNSNITSQYSDYHMSKLQHDIVYEISVLARTNTTHSHISFMLQQITQYNSNITSQYSDYHMSKLQHDIVYEISELVYLQSCKQSLSESQIIHTRHLHTEFQLVHTLH